MPNKKTNLGKRNLSLCDINAFLNSVIKDANAFEPEMNAFLNQFDVNNPYDCCVLMQLLSITLAGTILQVERNYPEFEDDLLENYRLYLGGMREDMKKNAVTND